MNKRAATSVYVLTLWLLTFLFFLRVLAQALVAFFEIPFLPSMEEWVIPSASPFSTSGVIPYPILLPIQVVILVLQIQVSRDFSRGHGYFVSLEPRVGRILLWLSYIYFASMVLRYIVTMVLYPERRWLGHTIPIFLHFVLAAFLFTLGHYATRRHEAANS
jgi:hypothetical protein